MKNFSSFQPQIKSITTSSTPKRDIERKRSFPKHKSKEKDQTASTEYPTTLATKTTFFIHSGKANNSGSQNYSETTMGSQLFRDSGFKEIDLKTVRLSPPRTVSKKPKTASGSPRRSNRETYPKRQNGMKWGRILTSKDKEIKNLEEITVTMNKEIHKAVNFLEKNKDIPHLLEEKEKQVEVLHDKLGMILQELDHLKLYTKARSIPNLQDTLREYRKLEKLEESYSQRAQFDAKETVRKEGNPSSEYNVNQFGNQESIDGLSHRERIQKRDTIRNNPYSINQQIIGDKTQIYKPRNTAHPHEVASTKAETKVFGSPQASKKRDPYDNMLEVDSKKKEHKQELPGSKSHRGKLGYEHDMNPLMKLLKNLQRSLSPGDVHNYQNKYKMYTEDPVKKLVPQYLKSKQLRQTSKEPNPETSNVEVHNKSKKPTVGKETIIEDTTRSTFDKGEKSQIKKSKSKHRGTSSLSPIREKSMTQKIKMAKRNLQLGDLKASPKAIIPKKSPKNVVAPKHIVVGKGKWKEKDVVQDVNTLLEEYYLVANKYKTLTKILRNKNEKLKKEVQDISESKIKIS